MKLVKSLGVFRRPISTYSIVAIDKKEGLMGVAVQSHWFSVGSVVPWVEAGVGVVATQSIAEISYGVLGLLLMKNGKTPEQTLKALTAVDPNSEVRQVAMLSADGKIATFTGKNCIPEAGHITGENFSVQANLMTSKEVWPAMASAFSKTNGNLVEKMIASLEAAETAGGDIRGRQSAAIVVVRTKASNEPWKDKVLDLRVEDHPNPVFELKRLVRIHNAYEHANRGDEFMAVGNISGAMREYEYAAKEAPEIDELKFWQAIAMLNHGMVREARDILKDIFKRNEGWKKVLKSLPKVGFLLTDEKTLNLVLE
ncbi:MAG: DUF1028 domain-containing protein [Thermoproteota archaeon]|nr:DUF1028 domain-containing protein [Candidatus Brockarchaeota archaeon]